MQNETHRLIYI